MYQKAVAHAEYLAKKRKRSLYTHWQMSSYTALSALSLDEAPELPEDKAREQQDKSEQRRWNYPGAHIPVMSCMIYWKMIGFMDLAKRKDISAQRDEVTALWLKTGAAGND